MRLRNLVALVVVVAAIGWMVLFFPHYVDKVKMEDCATQAVTDWAAWRNEEQARSKFRKNARARDLPEHLGLELCEFLREDENFVVECAWSVDVTIPVVDETRRLSFTVRPVAAPDGRLLD